jgi:hypothetical protein
VRPHRRHHRGRVAVLEGVQYLGVFAHGRLGVGHATLTDRLAQPVQVSPHPVEHLQEVPVAAGAHDDEVKGPVGLEVVPYPGGRGHGRVLRRGGESLDGVEVRRVRTVELGQPGAAPRDRALQRGELHDGAGVHQLGHLLRGQRGRDPVALEGRAGDQAGVLQVDQCLAHRGRRDLQVTGQRLDAQRRPGRDAAVEQYLQERLVHPVAQDAPGDRRPRGAAGSRPGERGRCRRMLTHSSIL